MTGRSLITLKEIAMKCGVSISTVSNVLNGRKKVGEDVKKRVLDVVRETGYQPNFYAQGIRKLRTNTIGIIVEDLCQFTSPFIVETVLDTLESHGYRTVLMNLRMYYRWGKSHMEDEDTLHETLHPVLQQMQAIKVDGIVYVGAHCRPMHALPEDFDIPVVVAYSYEEKDGITSVIIDDESSAYELTRLLLFKGHQQIGIIAGAEESYHTRERLAGIKRAMADYKIGFNPKNVRYGEWNQESGYHEARKLLESDITALWCMNDRMASGAYTAAAERGLVVGRDVSIVGFDDHEVATCLSPLLTTTRLPLYEIGSAAASILMEMFEGHESRKGGGLVKIKCTLCERKSIGKI